MEESQPANQSGESGGGGVFTRQRRVGCTNQMARYWPMMVSGAPILPSKSSHHSSKQTHEHPHSQVAHHLPLQFLLLRRRRRSCAPSQSESRKPQLGQLKAVNVKTLKGRKARSTLTWA